jgi:hypothetical protein
MKINLKAVGFLAIVGLGLRTAPECYAQSEPYFPLPDLVRITVDTNSQNVLVDVAVGLPIPPPCHSVSNWGQAVLAGNIATADAQFLVTTGYCMAVLHGVTNQYDLGSLPPGDYSFVFEAWGTALKTNAFIVPVLPRLALTITQLDGGVLRLSWPTNAVDYSLESAADLPSAWETVTNQPGTNGVDFVLILNSTDVRKYYRLRRYP